MVPLLISLRPYLVPILGRSKTCPNEGTSYGFSESPWFSKLTFSLLAATFNCRLLISFANSLDPDQDRQNVGPDLDPNRLTLILCGKIFLNKLILKTKSADDNRSMGNYPACKELIT